MSDMLADFASALKLSPRRASFLVRRKVLTADLILDDNLWFLRSRLPALRLAITQAV
jgi:hypothetical protein